MRSPRLEGPSTRPTRGRLGANGVFILPLMLLVSLAALAQEQPQLPPVRTFGQVLGAAPERLEGVLVRAGQPVAAQAAALTREDGTLFYSLEWNGQDVKNAWSGGPLSLAFRAGGALSATAVPLATSAALPPIVHVVEGAPRLPTTTAVVATAETTAGSPGQVTLTLVVARADGGPASGTVAWTGENGPAVTAPLELAGSSVTVSRLSAAVAEGTTMPRIWTVSWRPSSPAEPRLFRRVAARDVAQLAADAIGAGPSLPDRPALEKGDAGYALAAASVPLAAGQFLSLEMESSLGSEAAARRALDGWTLGGSAGFALDTVAVTPLPGGKSWISGSWLAPSAAELNPAQLRGPPGAVLDGLWKVRALSRFDPVQATESY